MKVNSIMGQSQNMLNVNKKKDQGEFSHFLKDALGKVNEYEMKSQELKTLAAAGKIDNIHEVMIAGSKSEIAVQFTVEVKNKVLDAYKQVMRLQV